METEIVRSAHWLEDKITKLQWFGHSCTERITHENQWQWTKKNLRPRPRSNVQVSL